MHEIQPLRNFFGEAANESLTIRSTRNSPAAWAIPRWSQNTSCSTCEQSSSSRTSYLRKIVGYTNHN